MDQKIVLELDRKVADQQSTLEKAGVAGFYVTTNPQVSAVGLAWHSPGATGPQRPHPLWGSSWSLGGLCHRRTSQLLAGHRPPCSGPLCATWPSSAVPCISVHLCVCQARAAADPAAGRVPASARFWQAAARLPTGSLPGAPSALMVASSAWGKEPASLGSARAEEDPLGPSAPQELTLQMNLLELIRKLQQRGRQAGKAAL